MQNAESFLDYYYKKPKSTPIIHPFCFSAVLLSGIIVWKLYIDYGTVAYNIYESSDKSVFFTSCFLYE